MAKKDQVQAQANEPETNEPNEPNEPKTDENGNEIVHVRSAMVLRGGSLSGRVTLFESEAIKEQVCGGSRKDANQKRVWNDTELLSRQTGLHTLHYRIDFAGCKLTELLQLHTKTTTVFKMLYNNTLKHWSETTILEACKLAKMNPRVFKAVDILSSRKSTIPTTTKLISKLANVDVATMTNEDKAKLLALAKALES